MRWLLAGCCGLALIHLSVSLQIFQKPRFLGVKSNKQYVMIYCLPSKKSQSSTVQWHKSTNYGETTMKNENRVWFNDTKLVKNGVIVIEKVRVEDNGLYVCEINNTRGPGTLLKVVKVSPREIAERRSKMKDALIILHGLLLAMCIAAVLLRKQKLTGKQDSLYEEPEGDHIYEGLAIETCGGDLYEELTVYAEADTTEAPWE